MAVTGTITTHFKDEDGVDLGKQLIEKDYLIDLYPNLFEEFRTAGLFLWGFNNNGKLGTNDTTARSSPTQTTTASSNWVSCAGGLDSSIACKSDGTLWNWGLNTNGQLGDNTTANRSSPVQTITFASNWKSVGAGNNTHYGIKTDGTLWCWGLNTQGQLGDNTVTHRSSPVQTVATGTNWKFVCGSAHVLSLKTDGTLWGWGTNGQGQLGLNNVTNRSSPIQTVTFATNWKQCDAGYQFSGAVKNDGTLWMWGSGGSGKLGNNATTNRSSPVQTVTFSSDWKQVACGNAFAGAIKTDGSLWMWGNNAVGQLGTNDLVHRSSPIQTIAYGNNWRQLACGGSYAFATKTDGTLWSWGANSFGYLGDNTNVSKSSPVQVGSLNNWKIIGNINSNNGADHGMALLDFNY